MAVPFLAARWHLGVFASVAALVAFAAIKAFWPGGGASLPEKSPEPARPPTLYCEFYNFTHTATVVSFEFAVSAGEKRGDLAFAQLSLVEHDDTKTDFSADPPHWRLGYDDNSPAITSSDGETQIILFGLRPHAAGVFWVEAGIRSNTYRNLDGKCRQAHLDRMP